MGHLFIHSFIHSFLFFEDFIYSFLERGEGKEKERERNINVWLPLTCPLLGTGPTTQACALTGNRVGDPLVRRPALNPLSPTSRGGEEYFYTSGIGKDLLTKTPPSEVDARVG